MTGIAWSKRLVKLLVVALVVATTCVALGIWQIARLHQKQDRSTTPSAPGCRAAPAPVETLLPTGVDPDDLRYHRAEATGTYDTAHEFVLYGRTQNSQAGNHILTPLRLADGTRDPRRSRLGAAQRRPAGAARSRLRPARSGRGRPLRLGR